MLFAKVKTLLTYILGILAGIGLVLSADRLFPGRLSQALRPRTTVQDTSQTESTASEQSSGKSQPTEAMRTAPVQFTHYPAVPSASVSGEIEVSRRNAITRAVEEVSPTVVGINVISMREYRARHPFADDPFLRQFFPDQIYRQKVENLGSGFIISPDGYVLTNEHVVQKASQIIVTTTSGEKYDAKAVGFDYDSDVALLKIDGQNLPFVHFGASEDNLIGEWAIALGNPFGLFSIHSQPSVSVGVISAVDRDFARNADGRLYQDMVQTDAAINRGNSGGPVVNAAGELIGMATMIFTESGGSIGLGFAIPSSKLKQIYEDLKSRGAVDRDFWVGFLAQNVTRLVAASLRLPELRGAVITDVEPNSPAAKAGLEPADVIMEVNGSRIDRAGDLQSFFRNNDLRVGDAVKLTIFRNGKTEEVKVKLEKRRN